MTIQSCKDVNLPLTSWSIASLKSREWTSTAGLRYAQISLVLLYHRAHIFKEQGSPTTKK